MSIAGELRDGRIREAPSRRAPGECRRLLLAAAVATFAKDGYAGASTRRIADRAGVAEVKIFRYFKSKAGLYHSAVVEPLLALADELDWAAPGDADDDPIDAWLEHVLHVVSQHRSLLAALLSLALLEAGDTSLAASLHSISDPLFAALERGAVAATGVRGDHSVTVRASFAMVVWVVVGGRQECLSGSRVRDAARDRAEVVGLLRYGLAGGRGSVLKEIVRG